MTPATEPFAVRDGGLWLEDVPLARLAAEREGRPAWVLSQHAVDLALRGLGAPRTIDVGRVGPSELLNLAAVGGHWAAVRSRHELELALRAGFSGARLVAAGPVRDDGFLKDALSAGVAVVPVRGEDERANVERLATFLGLPLPAMRGAPRRAPPAFLAAVGGLLARVLAPPPALELDAPLPATPRAGLVACSLTPGGEVRGTLAGLSGVGEPAPRAVLLRGPLRRGDWAVVPHPASAAPRGPHAIHVEPGVVMVRGARWRELIPRPLPHSH